jgi:hypothetical protein
VGALVVAVRKDLKALGAGDSSEGRLALSLAAWLEDPETPATARAAMSGRLLETLEVLRGRVEPVEESPLERIRRERDAGVARIADAKDRVRAGRGGAS